MLRITRRARLALTTAAGLIALSLVAATPQTAWADSGAMVVPITSIEGVTGQVGGYCHSAGAHSGIDISADVGDPVYAAYSGTLQRIASPGMGNYIIITHVDGYSTVYAHLSAYAAGAPQGSTVTTGQLIGYAGSTGNSTGPHLHFEVRLNGASQSGINVAFPCGSHTVALTPIAWSFPGLPAWGPNPQDNFAIYRPSNARFYIRAANGSLLKSVGFGTIGDLPAVGHFQDATTDNLGVYRPSNARFYIRAVDGSLLSSTAFGTTGDLPAVGHFQDATTDNLAVYRPSNSTFYIRALDGSLLRSVGFGTAGDVPAIGHFQDSPYDNLAVYRPSTSTFYIRALDGSLLTSIHYGTTGDLPAVGYFQGSAPDNLAVYRPSATTFYARAHGGPMLTMVIFGLPGDLPAIGQFQ